MNKNAKHNNLWLKMVIFTLLLMVKPPKTSDFALYAEHCGMDFLILGIIVQHVTEIDHMVSVTYIVVLWLSMHQIHYACTCSFIGNALFRRATLPCDSSYREAQYGFQLGMAVLTSEVRLLGKLFFFFSWTCCWLAFERLSAYGDFFFFPGLFPVFHIKMIWYQSGHCQQLWQENAQVSQKGRFSKNIYDLDWSAWNHTWPCWQFHCYFPFRQWKFPPCGCTRAIFHHSLLRQSSIWR